VVEERGRGVERNELTRAKVPYAHDVPLCTQHDEPKQKGREGGNRVALLGET
jgi:hypothetical protein